MSMDFQELYFTWERLSLRFITSCVAWTPSNQSEHFRRLIVCNKLNNWNFNGFFPLTAWMVTLKISNLLLHVCLWHNSTFSKKISKSNVLSGFYQVADHGRKIYSLFCSCFKHVRMNDGRWLMFSFHLLPSFRWCKKRRKKTHF
jgi:hypothetical protein